MQYKLIYSDRRSISLGVKDGEIIVRAPYGTSWSKIDGIVNSHVGWIENQLKKQERRNAKFSSLDENDIKRLRKAAKEILTAKTVYYANIMGIKYGRITITGAKTRFGSCSGQGNISYSYRLMLYPEEAIDYVVVHELAHILQMNHSPQFYKIVASVFPDYKRRAKMLKE